MTDFSPYQFNQKEFTKQLIKFREDNDYSTREVAEQVGISKAGYIKIEFGRAVPSALTFFNICSLMKLKMEKFFIIHKPKTVKNETK
jgi:DNA-binding XRE family transcriptional regulator